MEKTGIRAVFSRGPMKIEKSDIEAMETYFAGRKDVRIAYLFGSTARDGAGRDIDIAVLADSEAVRDGVLPLQTAVREDLIRILDTSGVDVVILNTAPLSLVHEVISCRRPVFVRDEETRVEFEARSNLAYYDGQPLRRFFWADLRKRIVGGAGHAAE